MAYLEIDIVLWKIHVLQLDHVLSLMICCIVLMLRWSLEGFQLKGKKKLKRTATSGSPCASSSTPRVL